MRSVLSVSRIAVKPTTTLTATSVSFMPTLKASSAVSGTGPLKTETMNACSGPVPQDGAPLEDAGAELLHPAVDPEGGHERQQGQDAADRRRSPRMVQEPGEVEARQGGEDVERGQHTPGQ